MKKVVIITLITISCGAGVVGCYDPFIPGKTKTFKLGPSGGYRGKPVGDCNRCNADRECQALGWRKAVDWNCRSVLVSGGFWGSWDQDVMYLVTCTR